MPLELCLSIVIIGFEILLIGKFSFDLFDKVLEYKNAPVHVVPIPNIIKKMQNTIIIEFILAFLVFFFFSISTDNI